MSFTMVEYETDISMNSNDNDPNKVAALKQQLHALRHDLAEKNTIIVTLQKQVVHNNRHHNGHGGSDKGAGMMDSDNSQRTGKVIEQLQLEIDMYKSQLWESKSNMQMVTDGKNRAEKQIEEHYEKTENLRVEIESLKRMLDRKERTLNEYESNNKAIESLVEKMRVMKDEERNRFLKAQARITELETQLSELNEAKVRAEAQYKLIQNEFERAQKRHKEDVAFVKQELASLKKDVTKVASKTEDIVLEAEARIFELTEERVKEVVDFEKIHKELKEEQQRYAVELATTLKEMRVHLETTSKETMRFKIDVSEVKSAIIAQNTKAKFYKDVQDTTE